MKIIRKSRQVKSKYIGVIDDVVKSHYGISPALDILGKDGDHRLLKAQWINNHRIHSDELPLPDYSFLTRRSSYFLEKQDLLSSIASDLWHNLSLKSLLKA